MSNPALRRVVRRETHSPRTVAVFIAATLVILALAYVGVEIVLHVLAQPALLLGPGSAVTWLVGLPATTPPAALVAAGAVIALVGLFVLVLAIKPGRLPKHEMTWGERAVLIDNGVIAASLAQRVSDEIGLPRDQVVVGVAHRSADVTVRPAAGEPVDAARVREIAQTELDSYHLTPSIRIRVGVERRRESEFV